MTNEQGEMKNFLVASTPGGIERQEKEGQIEQSFLDTLPKDLRGKRAEFEKSGFVFKDSHDDLFDNVQFPTGWRKQATEHSMWTHILDEKGRKRGAIFYKAAFYDRSAHAHLEPRFGVSQDYDGNRAWRVMDGDTVLHAGMAIPSYNWKDREAAEATQRLDNFERERCYNWLKAKYPDWQNPNAYWD